MRLLTFPSCLAAFCLSLGAAPDSKPLILILIGAPGSGKNTQSAYLQKEYGIPVISADALVKANPDAVASIQTIGLQRIDPRQDQIMNQLVQAKLSAIDASKGFILDGYPATKVQADFLANLGQQIAHPPTLVLQLDAFPTGWQRSGWPTLAKTQTIANSNLSPGNLPTTFLIVKMDFLKGLLSACGDKAGQRESETR